MPHIKRIFFIVTMLLFTTHVMGQYAIKQSVFGNGSSSIANSEYHLVSTVGQAEIGTTKNLSYINQVGFWYQASNLITSVEQVTEQLPQEFRLDQNYPNPFNPTTTIRFALPRPSSVKLTLFDILGREVAILVDEKFQPGEYNVVLDAKSLTSGVYVYRIDAEGFSDIKKLMILK